MDNEVILKDNKTYEYRLTYIDGNTERTHIFSAFVNADEMKQNLRHFLLACEWSNIGVDNILRLDDDE
jgi:hypothetical protein